LSLFLNAQVQGSYNVIEPLTQRGGPERARALFRLGLLASAASAVYYHNRQFVREDGQPWYNDIPLHERMGNIILMFGTTIDESGREIPHYARLAKGEAVRIAWNLIEHGLKWADGSQQAGVAEALLQWGRGSAPLAEGNPLPPFISAPMELASNYDTFRGMPIESARVRTLPVNQRVYASTTEPAISIAQLPVIRGRLSPIQIDWIINRMHGDTGRTAMRSLEAAGREAGVYAPATREPSAEIARSRIPVLGGIYAASGGYIDELTRREQEQTREAAVIAALLTREQSSTFQALSPSAQLTDKVRLATYIDAQVAALLDPTYSPTERIEGLRKYSGSKSAREDLENDRLINRYNAWSGGRGPKPSRQDRVRALRAQAFLNPRWVIQDKQTIKEYGRIARSAITQALQENELAPGVRRDVEDALRDGERQPGDRGLAILGGTPTPGGLEGRPGDRGYAILEGTPTPRGIEGRPGDRGYAILGR